VNLLLTCTAVFEEMKRVREFPFFRAVLVGSGREQSNLALQNALLGLDPDFTPVLPLLADDIDMDLLKQEGLNLLCGQVESEPEQPQGEMYIGYWCWPHGITFSLVDDPLFAKHSEIVGHLAS
jgi:hypothetical protein